LSFTTIQGGNGVDSFIGTSGVDVLVAFNVNRLGFVGAQADNDLVQIEQPATGVTSIFTVYGGNGDDELTINSALEFSKINGNVGNDTISACGTIAQSLVSGGMGNDYLEVGDLINSTYSGGQGDDQLYFCYNYNYSQEGFYGEDVIANSTINGNAGNDLIDFTYVGKITNSVIYGGADNDTIRDFYGNSTNVTVNGNLGNDNITYGGDSNGLTIFGGDGDDTIDCEIDTGSAYLSGDLGNDTIFGSDSGDTIRGGDGNDSLLGFDGGDSINGGTGNDYIEGGFGNDTLNGGEGNDSFGIYGTPGFNGDNNLITGGAGADTYTYIGGYSGEDPTQDSTERYIINAVSESSASTSGGTWDIFNPDSFNGQPYAFPGDKLDISAVANTLAGGPLLGGISLDYIDAGVFTSLADLKTYLDEESYAASSPNGLKGYYLDFTILPTDGTATNFNTLWIQNNQVSFTSDDLLFQFNGGFTADYWINAGDIIV
jgi:Ca2+-binding RTX toxin-like protein